MFAAIAAGGPDGFACVAFGVDADEGWDVVDVDGVLCGVFCVAVDRAVRMTVLLCSRCVGRCELFFC